MSFSLFADVLSYLGVKKPKFKIGQQLLSLKGSCFGAMINTFINLMDHKDIFHFFGDVGLHARPDP